MVSRLKTSLGRIIYKNFSPTRHKIVKFFETEFVVRPDNYIDRRLWIEGGYEKMQIETLLHFASKNHFDAFLDIGANFGLYSCILGVSRLIKNILSFECDKRNLYQLYGHIRMNLLFESIAVHPIAIGDRKTTVYLNNAPDDNTGKTKISLSSSGEAIEQDTIDNILSMGKKSLLIKIDVEGYELPVLKGMEQTLRNNQCLIQMEILDENATQARDLLVSAGYKQIKRIETDYYFTNMDVT